MAAALVAASDGAIAVFYRPAVGAEPIRVSVREAAAVEFESVLPIRRVRAYRGARNFVGAWWLSTTNRHVTFESWCERDHLIAFDFDPHIVGIAAQPFRFEFTTTADRVACHTPDYFLRTADGDALVADVKPDELISDDDRLKFSGTAVLCDRAGWAYRRFCELPAVWAANLRWLAGYRHTRVKDNATAARAAKIVDRDPGITLGELAQLVGQPPVVVPTIFHMFWHHNLITDLAQQRLSMSARVYPGDRR